MVPFRRIFSAILRRLERAYCAVMLRLADPEYCLAHLNEWARVIGATAILKSLGAQVGKGVRIEHGLLIQNARGGRCENLQVGDRVYIGPGCCIDLACPVVIEDEAAIAAGVSLITHGDVGSRPLSAIYPRQEGRIVIRRGSWLGVRATVLHGVTIGPLSIVGAMSLVKHDVEPGVLAFGIPCLTVRPLNVNEIAEKAKTCAT